MRYCLDLCSPHKVSPRGQLRMFSKGTAPKRVLAGTPKSPATQACEEEYLGWRRKNGVLPHTLQSQPPKSPCGVHFRQGQTGLEGRARELPSPLAARADVGADGIGAAELTYSADPASAEALLMCQGAHTEASQDRKR